MIEKYEQPSKDFASSVESEYEKLFKQFSEVRSKFEKVEKLKERCSENQIKWKKVNKFVSANEFILKEDVDWLLENSSQPLIAKDLELAQISNSAEKGTQTDLKTAALKIPNFDDATHLLWSEHFWILRGFKKRDTTNIIFPMIDFKQDPILRSRTLVSEFCAFFVGIEKIGKKMNIYTAIEFPLENCAMSVYLETKNGIDYIVWSRENLVAGKFSAPIAPNISIFRKTKDNVLDAIIVRVEFHRLP